MRIFPLIFNSTFPANVDRCMALLLWSREKSRFKRIRLGEDYCWTALIDFRRYVASIYNLIVFLWCIKLNKYIIEYNYISNTLIVSYQSGHTYESAVNLFVGLFSHYFCYRKPSSIRRTKSQNFSTTRLVLQLPLPNSLKLGVESVVEM